METGERMIVMLLVILAGIAGGFLAGLATRGDDGAIFASAIICAASVVVIAAQLKLFSIDRTMKGILAQMRREYDQREYDRKITDLKV